MSKQPNQIRTAVKDISTTAIRMAAAGFDPITDAYMDCIAKLRKGNLQLKDTTKFRITVEAFTTIPETEPAKLSTHDKALAMLKEMSKNIREPEQPWWMDEPDRGGFDAEAIDKLIKEMEK